MCACVLVCWSHSLPNLLSTQAQFAALCWKLACTLEVVCFRIHSWPLTKEQMGRRLHWPDQPASPAHGWSVAARCHTFRRYDATAPMGIDSSLHLISHPVRFVGLQTARLVLTLVGLNTKRERVPLSMVSLQLFDATRTFRNGRWALRCWPVHPRVKRSGHGAPDPAIATAALLERVTTGVLRPSPPAPQALHTG